MNVPRESANCSLCSPIRTADSAAVIFSRVHAEISPGGVEYALIDVTRVSRHLSIVKYRPVYVCAYVPVYTRARVCVYSVARIKPATFKSENSRDDEAR